MVPVIWATFGIFSAWSKWFPVTIGDHGQNLVISLLLGDKATINGVMALRLTLSPKIPSAKICWKSFPLHFLGSRRHSPHGFSSKGPNYQGRVLLISAGATEGHFKGKTPRRKVTKGVFFLHDNAPAHWALATQKKRAYLGFQCLDHPPYSLDLAPLDYHLFPELKKKLKGRHFSSYAEVTAATETWLDGQPSEFFLSGLRKLEQQAKKCIELC